MAHSRGVGSAAYRVERNVSSAQPSRFIQFFGVGGFATPISAGFVGDGTKRSATLFRLTYSAAPSLFLRI
jgi:hypothetical protein